VQRRCSVPGLLEHSGPRVHLPMRRPPDVSGVPGITDGMRRRFDCYDNPVMEFFSTVKREEAECFPCYGDAKMGWFDCLEVFYCHRRWHSTLGLISPRPSGVGCRRARTLPARCSPRPRPPGKWTTAPDRCRPHLQPVVSVVI
jgi:hypothetical protein